MTAPASVEKLKPDWEVREQKERESQPAYWLKEIVLELRTMNAHLNNIDQRLYDISQKGPSA